MDSRMVLLTYSWWRWVHGEDDRCSRAYDFVETHPVWENWWFRIGVVVVLISIFWFFLSVL